MEVISDKLLTERDTTRVPASLERIETNEIHKRRKKIFPERTSAGEPLPDDELAQADQAVEPILDSASMALSGGGIRSASFNLGVVQSLLSRGVIRWIDFQSTVSGGGFFGTYFSTLLCHDDTERLNRDLPLVPKPKKGHAEPVQRFIRGGSYLKDAGLMSDWFLLGFLLNGTAWVSFLICVTSGLALLWRMLDSPQGISWVRDHSLYMREYYRDWSRPFLFFVVLITAWLLVRLWGIVLAMFRRRAGEPNKLSSLLLKLAGFSLLIGLAVLLATDSIAMTGFLSISEIHPWYVRNINGHRIIGTLLAVFVALSILPFLNPVRIFRSELRQPGKFESTVLRFAGGTLLVLMPFYLTFLFAKEGISSFCRDRGPELVAADLPDPFELLQILQADYQAADSSADSQLPEATAFRQRLDSSIYQTLQQELPQFYFPGTRKPNAAQPDAPAVAKPNQGPASTESDVPELGANRKDANLPADRELNLVSDVLHGNADLNLEIAGHTLVEALNNDSVLSRLWKIAVAKRDQNREANSAAATDSNATASNVAAEKSLKIAGEELVSRLIFLGKELKKKDADKKPIYSYGEERRAKRLVAAYLAGIVNRHILNRGPQQDGPVRFALQLAEKDNQTNLQVSSGDAMLSTGMDALLSRAQRLRERELFSKDLWPRALSLETGLSPEELKQLNRLILEASFPDTLLRERKTAGLSLTWWDDQWVRLKWFLGSLLAMVLVGLVVDWNATSLHGFYRKKLRDAYVTPGTASERMQDLNTVAKGGPYHFLIGTLNFFDDWPWKSSDYTSMYTFFFSPKFCGSQALPRYVKTAEYCRGELDVATAAAISGAAFSPAIIRNPLLFYMAMLLNVRLGQWLPNPALVAQGKIKPTARRAIMAQILLDFVLTRLGLRQPKDWKYCFITDGGHNDNLGVAPLVFRRCRLIVISDATRDDQYRFPDFLKAFRRYRIRGGMEFCRLETWSDLQKDRPLDLSPLRPEEQPEQDEIAHGRGWLPTDHDDDAEVKSSRRPSGPILFSQRHFLLSKLTYPDDDKDFAIIVYLKSSMTGDEPADLRQWQIEHPQFPHDPTTDQFFTENQVESYRQLGHHIGDEFCQAILRGRKRLGFDRTAVSKEQAAKDEPRSPRPVPASRLRQPLIGHFQGAAFPDLWEQDFSVDDLINMLLVGYFQGKLPNGPRFLLDVIRRSGDPEVCAEAAIVLSNGPLEARRPRPVQPSPLPPSRIATNSPHTSQDLAKAILGLLRRMRSTDNYEHRQLLATAVHLVLERWFLALATPPESKLDQQESPAAVRGFRGRLVNIVARQLKSLLNGVGAPPAARQLYQSLLEKLPALDFAERFEVFVATHQFQQQKRAELRSANAIKFVMEDFELELEQARQEFKLPDLTIEFVYPASPDLAQTKLIYWRFEPRAKRSTPLGQPTAARTAMIENRFVAVADLVECESAYEFDQSTAGALVVSPVKQQHHIVGAMQFSVSQPISEPARARLQSLLGEMASFCKVALGRVKALQEA